VGKKPTQVLAISKNNERVSTDKRKTDNNVHRHVRNVEGNTAG